MQIVHTLENKQQALALTIGNFDGVHRGHQSIIQTLTETAEQKHLLPAAMTFSPHAKALFQDCRNYLISSDAEKADYLGSHGIELLYQIPFDLAFSQIKAADFVKHLAENLKVKHLLVGDDFRFGYQGRGDFSLLQTLSKTYDFTVENTPTVYFDKHRISSSRVRNAIQAADFSLIKNLLGRQLAYSGTVIADRQLGHQIGFPTANLQFSDTRLLPQGVFAVHVHIEGVQRTYQGMCNIGTKPTVDDRQHRQIETHLFDFSGDLYGKHLTVIPMSKIREEMKFSGIEQLVQQLQQDKRVAQERLTQRQ